MTISFGTSASFASLPGAALGALLGMGLLLGWAGCPGRRPTLAQRLAPVRRHLGVGKTDRFGVTTALASSAMAWAVRGLERFGPTRAVVARRLQRAGSPVPLGTYRQWQVLALAAGASLGLFLALLTGAGQRSGGIALFLLGAIGAAVGYAALDSHLSRLIKRREAQVQQEFPAAMELLSLAVTAGLSPAAAMEVVAAESQGIMARELALTLSETRDGARLNTALENLAHRLDLPVVSSFTRALFVALERGSPLAETLAAQAADAREDARRRLLEQGGKREVAMLAPVVLLVLPVTVIFAVFPSLSALRLQF